MSIETKFLNASLNGEPVKRWIACFGHGSSDATPSEVMVEGSLRPIADIAKEIFHEKTKKISSCWRYDHRGFVKTSYIKFTQLTPTHRHDGDGNYYFVVKSKQKGFCGLGRHCYMELINSNGDGYSVGLCGPTTFPLKGTRGAIVSPDPKEASTGYERQTKIQIPQVVFEQTMHRINSDKLEGKEYFHLIKNNCSKYVSTICEQELGIKMDNEEFISQALTRVFFRALRIKPGQRFLKFVNVVAAFVRALFAPLYSLVWLSTGAWYSDKKGRLAKFQQAQKKGCDSIFKKLGSGFKKFFSCNYLKIATGWKISAWQDRIKATCPHVVITLEEARNNPLNHLVAL